MSKVTSKKATKLMVDAITQLRENSGFTSKQIMKVIDANLEGGISKSTTRCVLTALKRGEQYGFLKANRGRFTLKVSPVALRLSKQGDDDDCFQLLRRKKRTSRCASRKSRSSRRRSRRSCRRKSRSSRRRKARSSSGGKSHCRRKRSSRSRRRRSRSASRRRHSCKSVTRRTARQRCRSVSRRRRCAAKPQKRSRKSSSKSCGTRPKKLRRKAKCRC